MHSQTSKGIRYICRNNGIYEFLQYFLNRSHWPDGKKEKNKKNLYSQHPNFIVLKFLITQGLVSSIHSLEPWNNDVYCIRINLKYEKWAIKIPSLLILDVKFQSRRYCIFERTYLCNSLFANLRQNKKSLPIKRNVK